MSKGTSILDSLRACNDSMTEGGIIAVALIFLLVGLLTGWHLKKLSRFLP